MRTARPDPGPDARGTRGLQEFLILDRGEAPIEGVELEGIAAATPTPEVLEALAAAGSGDRRPVEPGDLDRADPGSTRDARGDRGAPREGGRRSPLVGGHAVKGPTDAFVTALGCPLTAAGIASLYAEVIDGIVVDEGDPGPEDIDAVASDPRCRVRRGAATSPLRCSTSPAISDRRAAGDDGRMRATAIIPVKRFGAASSDCSTSLDRPQRAALVKAMLADVLAAVAASERVERVIVVTGEGRAERIALARRAGSGRRSRCCASHDRGHSEAATLGIVRAPLPRSGCAALLPGDCPLLDPGELDAALDRMRPGRVAVVPDRHGTGTNALLLAPADAIGPAFGEGSMERHRDRAGRAGHDVAVERLDSLALDLDTPDDLAALTSALAARPERAPATAAASSGWARPRAWRRDREPRAGRAPGLPEISPAPSSVSCWRARRSAAASR